MRPLRVLLLPCIAAVLLAGCGTRFVYTQLDWLIPWYLRDYVSLQAGQRSELDRRLGRLLDWHCQSELPAYARLLRDLHAAVAQGAVSVETLDARLQRGEQLWDQLMQAIAADAADLLGGLDADQRVELAAAFQRRNAETRRDFLDGTPAALRAQRIERMEKRLQRWFGRLNDAQRERIGRWSDALAPTGEDWLAHRIAWQQELLGVLNPSAPPSDLTPRIADLLRHPEARWAPGYRARVAENRLHTLQLLADLSADATAEQRHHLLSELDKLATQFERLSCTAGAGTHGPAGR